MVQGMAQTSQPAFFSTSVSSFAAFDAAHGWAVNLFVVIALAAYRSGLFDGAAPGRARGGGRRRLPCLADWVLIEDLGFLGGVGTDPNSMIPMALIFISGYVAMTRLRRGRGQVASTSGGAGSSVGVSVSLPGPPTSSAAWPRSAR